MGKNKKTEVMTTRCRYKNLEVVGPYTYSDIRLTKEYHPIAVFYKIKTIKDGEGKDVFLYPFNASDKWVKGYMISECTQTKKIVCSFQAKPGYDLIHSKRNGFEYVANEDRLARIDKAQEELIKCALEMYDKDIKGKELYAALNDMMFLNPLNVKAVALRAAIAFARVGDGDYEKSYYKGAMQTLKDLRKFS